MADKRKPKRHDHRQSLWLIAGGYAAWCYRCGAWRINEPRVKWVRPTGPDGPNPAIREELARG